MELKVTKDYSFPEARRLVERSMGPVTYASVAAMSGGPRSSPRQTPRTRVQLDPGKSYSKYPSASNSSSPGPAIPEQRAADVTTDSSNLQSNTSKEDDKTSIHSNDSLPPATGNSSSQEDSEKEGDSNDNHEEAHEESHEESDNESLEQEEQMELTHSDQLEGAAVSTKTSISNDKPPEKGPISREDEEDDPKAPYVDTREFLLDVLSKKYNDPEQIRDHMVRHCLKEVDDGLRINGYTRPSNLLLARASKPFGSFQIIS
jgi:hypothetical protein